MAKGEVLIAGSGPTGLLLAILLHKEQVPFKIINKKSGPTDLSKALAVHARTLEVFKDAGILEPFMKVAHKIKGVRLAEGAKHLASVTFEKLDSEFNYVSIIPQSETEKILVQKLEELGGKIHWNTELCDFEKKGDEVLVSIKNDKGEMEQEEFSWVAGCDGMHSCVREKNEIPYEGSDLSEALSFADLTVHGDIPSDYATIGIGKNKDGVIFFIPLPGGNRKRLIVNNCKLDHKEDANNEYFTKMIKERYDESMSTSDVDWSTIFHINYREASLFVKWPFFLIGDAAHVHSPIGGQGMNTGLQDAYNLAWKLGRLFHGQGSRQLIETYHEERHANALKLLKATKLLTNITASKGAFLKWIRPHLIKFLMNKEWVTNKLMYKLSQHDVNYRGMSLSQEYKASVFSKKGRHFNNGPKAGDRVVDCKVQLVGNPEVKTVLDLIQGSLFQNFLFLAGAKDLSSAGLSEVKHHETFQKISRSRIMKNLVISNKEFLENEKEFLANVWKENVIIDEGGVFHKAYNATFPCLYLIRPDNYIGLKSKDLCFHNVRKYIFRILDNL
ncbi:MAG: 3-(3-hydroxy-phenyl)propionate/3-hydroxycinnamic acid hydroxylase [Chlamydiia bacterium]|nr:3-(3-hydroxy-phenyl)propionate/3-hydroxycinnamic acid hydroxylase [Chlamydiia bacterium]